MFTSSSEEWPRIPITKEKDRFVKISKYGEKLALLENFDASDKLSYRQKQIKKEFKDNFFLEKIEISPANREIRLYDQKKSNKPKFVLGDIPEQVLDLPISGYIPIKEWLKFHSQPYSRMELKIEDLLELQEITERIEKQLTLMDKIDYLIEPLLAGNHSLITPK